MKNTVDEYLSAEGYGIFCGKKCVAEKKAQGIPPKRGAKNIAAFQSEQAQLQQSRSQQEQSSGGSNTGIIIGGVLLLGVIGTIIFIIKKRKAK